MPKSYAYFVVNFSPKMTIVYSEFFNMIVYMLHIIC